MFNGFYTNSNKKRLFGVMGCFFTIVSLLSLRLYFLQTKPTERVTSQYQNHQTENISDISYPVLDTNGKDLLQYKKKYVLVIDKKPFKLNNYEDSLQDLMALNFIMKGEDSTFNYSDIILGEGKVYYNLSEETYNKIKSLKNLKGIYVYVYDERDKKYAWTVGNIFANIKEKDASKGGLEGVIYEEVKDNSIPKMDFFQDEKAVYNQSKLSGIDENKGIRLTIDKDIQDKIDAVLKDDKYGEFKNIGVTVMESKSGKIKAMAQKDEGQANINLGIEGSGYEPGSIFKVITLATALEEGKVNLGSTFECDGTIDNWATHGVLTVASAFSKSCNDIFAQVGTRVGYEKMLEYSSKLGLYNQVLGIKAENSIETKGKVPKKDASMNNTSIGQSMTLSPIQMLGAINSVVNNGEYVKPYILQDIVDSNDKVVKSYDTKSEKVFSSSTAKIVKNSMRDVVVNGTGTKAYVEGVDIGGKTGTATDVIRKVNHLWFCGFFTVNNVEYSMIVLIPDQTQKDADIGGGISAAPIFKDIILSLKNK